MAEALDFRDPEWVADQLNIDKNAVYRFLNEGLLPGLQLGRKWLISESSLVEHLKAEEQRQTQARRQLGTGVVGDAEFSRLFERFSERARQVVLTAPLEALKRNVSYIGQEHILLGVFAVPGSVGLTVLTNLGVSADRVRTAINSIVDRGPSSGRTALNMELTPRAKRSIELAVEEARELNHAYVGVEHLLLGLLRVGEGIGFEVLTRFGITLDRARAEVQRVVAADSERSLAQTDTDSPDESGPAESPQ